MSEWQMGKRMFGLIKGLGALLLVGVAYQPVLATAQSLGGIPLGANVLTSGMGMGMSNSLSDPCASALDASDCRKKLLSGQTGNTLTNNKERQIFPIQDAQVEKVKPQRKPEQPSEFQLFIEASAQKILPMYGYDLFENPPDTFAPVDNIPVAPDYMIGPGDELVIKGWGQVDIDVRVVVNRNGEIDLPKVGTVHVAGVHYENLQKHLKSEIGRVFRNFELNVTLGTLRSIQVFVVGQARSPGNYTISSLSTLVNALFASGGPSKKGSMRHIQVKRNGKLVSEFDMYDLLLRGDKSKDVSLQPGDVIYIPPVERLAAISGSVNNPAIYELKQGDTTLSELIELAGGVTTTAWGQTAKVERIEARKGRTVVEFQLNSQGLAQSIKDGDYVELRAINPRFDNAVTLRGNIAQPGRYPWKEGMRINDLIPNKEMLIAPEYWEAQNRRQAQSRNLTRESLLLQNKDGEEPEFTNAMRGEPTRVNDRGINSSVAQQRLPREKASPLEILSVPEVNLEYAVIERLVKEELTTALIPFNLGKAINGDPEQNFMLQPGDTIRIFSKEDMQVPVSNRSVYVRLEGEINNAGVYKALPGETLRQLLIRVGGVTPDAYLFAAEFNRESVRVLQQKRMQEMLDQMEDSVKRNQASLVQASLGREDSENAKFQAEAQAALISRFRRVQATGRIVLEIPADSTQIVDLPDIVLEDGDRFMVPAKPSTVSVMGMVYTPNAFIYRQGKSAGDYINQAGGPTRDADMDREYILRADGSVVSAQNSNSFWGGNFRKTALMPGDTVVVPEMLDKFVFTKSLKDWSQIFYQFALGVAGLKVLFP